MAQATMHEVTMPRLSDSMEEGTILDLAEAGGRGGRGRRGAGRNRDRQGEHGLRGRRRGDAARDPGRRGRDGAAGHPDRTHRRPRAGDASSAEGGATPAGPVAEDGAAADGPSRRSSATPASPMPPEAQPAPAAGNGHGARPKASPLARRLAEERGIELAKLTGSGPAGRIVKADVLTALRPRVHGDGGRHRAEARSRARRDQPRQTRGRDRQRRRPGSGADQTPGHGRQADGGVEGDCASLLSEARSIWRRGRRRGLRLKELAAEGEVVPSFNDMVVKASAIALGSSRKPTAPIRTGALSSTRG